jgi:hypothetical protein
MGRGLGALVVNAVARKMVTGVFSEVELIRQLRGDDVPKGMVLRALMFASEVYKSDPAWEFALDLLSEYTEEKGADFVESKMKQAALLLGITLPAKSDLGARFAHLIHATLERIPEIEEVYAVPYRCVHCQKEGKARFVHKFSITEDS